MSKKKSLKPTKSLKDCDEVLTTNYIGGGALDDLLSKLVRSVEVAKASRGGLPEKIWMKQQFAIGINDVTRVLERMPAVATATTHSAHSSIEAHTISGRRRAPLVPLQADCKFLIFAHHLPMVNAIEEYLLKKKVKCIRIDGQTPPTTRQTLVTDFQNKDNIRAAVLSIKAGGVGLTLTAASTVIFAELSWTPGDLIQAEDRAHRIGQVSSVNIYYLLANETVDDMIWETVQGKLENLGQMLDGQEKALDVSQIDGRPSPSKHQKKLDGYLKRCSNSTEGEVHTKNPRF